MIPQSKNWILSLGFARDLGRIVTEINMEKPGLKLQGLSSKLEKLHHTIDDKSNKLGARIDRVEEKVEAADRRAHTTLDRYEAHVDDLEKVATAFDGSNG